MISAPLAVLAALLIAMFLSGLLVMNVLAGSYFLAMICVITICGIGFAVGTFVGCVGSQLDDIDHHPDTSGLDLSDDMLKGLRDIPEGDIVSKVAPSFDPDVIAKAQGVATDAPAEGEEDAKSLDDIMPTVEDHEGGNDAQTTGYVSDDIPMPHDVAVSGTDDLDEPDNAEDEAEGTVVSEADEADEADTEDSVVTEIAEAEDEETGTEEEAEATVEEEVEAAVTDEEEVVTEVEEVVAETEPTLDDETEDVAEPSEKEAAEDEMADAVETEEADVEVIEIDIDDDEVDTEVDETDAPADEDAEMDHDSDDAGEEATDITEADADDGMDSED